MQLGVQANEVSLAQLFSQDIRLVMPPYQRSYSWTKKETLDLLSDFREAVDAGRSHFIGAVVLVENKTENTLEIVDGQQRLTTLTLVLAVLRDLEEDDGLASALHSYIAETKANGQTDWRVSLNSIDGPYFRAAIQQAGACLSVEEDTAQSDSQKRMASNANAVRESLSSLRVAERRLLADAMTNACALVKVTVANRDEGYKVFRVLNTRGNTPNAHDIIKTELLEQANIPLEQADIFANQWAEYGARLGDKAFDNLLRQIRVVINPTHSGDLVSGFRKSVLTKISALDFLQNHLPRFVQAYEEIETASVAMGNQSEAVNIHLNRLLMLEHQGWRAPALKFLYERRKEEDSALVFFRGLERLGFVIQLIVHDRIPRSRRYRRVMENLHADRSLFAKGGPLDIGKDEAKKVSQRLRGRFSTYNQRRAMVLRANSALVGGEEVRVGDDATVEHVLPRNPEPSSVWVDVWPNAAVRRELSDTLGNFAILPDAQNQKAARKEFREKREIFFDKSGHATFAITRDIRDIEVWTPEVVRQRADRLAEALMRDWGLDA